MARSDQIDEVWSSRARMEILEGAISDIHASLEKDSARIHQTEIFIETPYRNDSMMSDLLATLQPSTRLCVAVNITQPDETILTRTVREWRSSPPTIGKRPCVFLILAK